MNPLAKTIARLALLLSLLNLAGTASAQVPMSHGSAGTGSAHRAQVDEAAVVRIEQAWVRASVPGQRGTGGYMKLTARERQQLVGVSSPVAGVAEVHEMKMDGEVMKMRAVGALDLPAGKTVELKPGGLHLMLMDLKQPLAPGSGVPLTLVFKDARGVQRRVETRVLVSASAPGAATPDSHKHKH